MFARNLRRRLRNRLAHRIQAEGFYGSDAFGLAPRASRDGYMALFEAAKGLDREEVRTLESEWGFAVEKAWVDNLALHTQVVVKDSALNWDHGRLLYSALRRYISQEQDKKTPLTVLETGTARGFSALCMAKALADAGRDGMVITLDSLPHDEAMYWNCVDDWDGPTSRSQLLALWPEELRRTVFVQGWTRRQLVRLGISRIGFCFLDAQHTHQDVLAEFRFVSSRQKPGDVIVFDDVTPGVFPGVVSAVREIENEGSYAIEFIGEQSQRGYAIAIRE